MRIILFLFWLLKFSFQMQTFSFTEKFSESKIFKSAKPILLPPLAVVNSFHKHIVAVLLSAIWLLKLKQDSYRLLNISECVSAEIEITSFKSMDFESFKFVHYTFKTPRPTFTLIFFLHIRIKFTSWTQVTSRLPTDAAFRPFQY